VSFGWRRGSLASTSVEKFVEVVQFGRRLTLPLDKLAYISGGSAALRVHISIGESAEQRRHMMKGDVETYHENGKWKNKVEGSSRASSTHGTKREAVEVGRQMAITRKAEHFIRNLDGRIGERNTYPRSRDPRNIPG
jgi:uncharacterized protein DUF2188